MAIEDQDSFASWRRLKPDTKFAVAELASALAESNDSTAEVIEAYLFAKRTLAQSMQALLRAQLSAASRVAFRELRERMQAELCSRFSGRVPGKCLRIPYGTKANEELFAVLHQEMGLRVDSARLRAINADDTHTERRIRELRELGLTISSERLNGSQYYTLDSLDFDSEKIRHLVVKTIGKAKALSPGEKKEMIVQLSR